MLSSLVSLRSILKFYPSIATPTTSSCSSSFQYVGRQATRVTPFLSKPQEKISFIATNKIIPPVEKWERPHFPVSPKAPKLTRVSLGRYKKRAPLRAMAPLNPIRREDQRVDPEVPVIHFQGGEVGKITLRKDIFLAPIRSDIIARVVRWQLAKRRQGTHSAKTRAEVRGGGRKPHPQKGQGRARQGSRRAPHMKGGGVVFPPKPRSHEYDLQRNVRALGMKAVLSAKLAQGKLVVVDGLQLDTPKTQSFLNVLKKNGWASALIIPGAEVDNNLRLASSNIYEVDVLPQRGLNVYSILESEYLLLTKESVDYIQNVRFRKPSLPF